MRSTNAPGVNYLPAFPVPHPGELLREEILPAAGLTPSEAARRLGVSRQLLHCVLHGRHGITAAMAWRLSALFGNTPQHWLGMQLVYDLQQSQKREAAAIRRIEPLGA